MSKQALLSVMGLYTNDDTIFENMQIPEGMDKELIVDSILSDCMELETIYPEPEAMKAMISVWSRRELPVWNRIRQAELAEYNPIENYDRHQSDKRSITRAGKDEATGNNALSSTEKVEAENTGTSSKTTSGTISQEVEETGSVSETNTHKYAAFDIGTLADQTQDVRSSSGTNDQTTTGSTSETETENSSGTSEENKTANSIGTTANTVNRTENTGETFTSYIHGNIGVTTSQQMLESELTLAPKINTINYIVNSFKMRFCVLVY